MINTLWTQKQIKAVILREIFVKGKNKKSFSEFEWTKKVVKNKKCFLVRVLRKFVKIIIST